MSNDPSYAMQQNVIHPAHHSGGHRQLKLDFLTNRWQFVRGKQQSIR